MVWIKVSALEAFTKTTKATEEQVARYAPVSDQAFETTTNFGASRWCKKNLLSNRTCCCKHKLPNYGGSEIFELESDGITYAARSSKGKDLTVKEMRDDSASLGNDDGDLIWQVIRMKAKSETETDEGSIIAASPAVEDIYASVLVGKFLGNRKESSYFVNYATKELLRRGVLPTDKLFQNHNLKPNHEDLRLLGQVMVKLANDEMKSNKVSGCCPSKIWKSELKQFRGAPKDAALQVATDTLGLDDDASADDTKRADDVAVFVSSLARVDVTARAEDSSSLGWVIAIIVVLLIAVAALFYKKFYHRKQVLQTITSSSESAAGSLVGMTLSLCVVGFVAIAMILRTRASKSSSKDAITSVELTELALLDA